GSQLIIRSKANRSIFPSGNLETCLSTCAVSGRYSIDIHSDLRRKRLSRTANLEVRFSPVEIQKSKSSSPELPPTVKLYVVEAKEIENTENPIHWRILTSMPIATFQDARQVLHWYSCRWLIEEVFRILKKEGYDIEASELESAKAIRKLGLLMLTTILKIFQMRYCYDIPEGETLESKMCFNENEIDCLKQQNVLLQGKTDKTKNPHSENSLAWATWIIARLGGWKGYASERNYGITTLWIGLKRFSDIYQGWLIHKLVYTR
ncbi:MAG: IS4 family transposase, partial [Flavobacteriales bacterium]